VRDLWHAGTGASDNASSVATMMEAMRILKILKLPMQRTVQIALWGGEECGILGSREYVEKHVNSEHAKVSICINRDSGAGRLRGVFLMENKKLAPIFARWMEPFHYLGFTTLRSRVQGGDHLHFRYLGIVTTSFLQDQYPSWASHTNMDTLRGLLRQISSSQLR